MPSLLAAFCVQLGFLEISVPTVAKKALISFAFSSSRIESVLIIFLLYWSNLLSPFRIRRFIEYFLICSSGFRRINLSTKESTFCSSQVACYLIPNILPSLHNRTLTNLWGNGRIGQPAHGFIDTSIKIQDISLKNPSQPRPEILEIRHFRCHRNYENCIVKRNLMAAPQVVLVVVC